MNCDVNVISIVLKITVTTFVFLFILHNVVSHLDTNLYAGTSLFSMTLITCTGI